MNETTTTSNATTAGQLGTVVSWRVPNEVDVRTLQKAMFLAGIDPALFGDLAPRNALSRAFHDMREGRVIRKLRQDGDFLYFQFTREYLDAHEITYERETELCLNVKTGSVTCAVDAIRDKAQRLLEEHQGKRLTSDLTRLVQRVYSQVDADLIPIREQGGAYYVPQMHTNIVNQTRILLREIGGNLRAFDVRLGSEDTAASVAESMSDYLAQLIHEFKESCADVSGSSRRDVKERRHESVAQLRRKLELYRGLLSGYADQIDESIEAAEAELIRKLAQGDDEGPSFAPGDHFGEQSDAFAA